MRNKVLTGLIGAIALLVMTVMVGLATSVVIFGQKNQALTRANSVADNARREAERKEQVAVAAARAANEQNRSAVEAHVDMIVLLQRKLRFVPAIQDEREQLLDKASTRLAGAAKAMTDLRRDVDWAPQDEGHNWRSLARAHQAQGSLNLSRNQVKEAIAQFHQAEEIITKLSVAEPADQDVQVNLIRTKRQLGYVTMEQVDDTEGAQSYFNKAIELSRAGLARKPDSDVFKSELANSLGGLAISETRLGHLEKARDLYRQEIETRESFSATQAGDFESRRELAGFISARAAMYVHDGDNDEALRLYDKVAALRSQLATERADLWPVQNDLALSYNNQASMRFPNGKDPALARDFHRKALEILKKRAKADPENAENKKVLAETLYYEATCALHAGDKAGAAAGFQEGLALCRELVKQPDPLKGTQVNLMLALGRCGEHLEAAKIADLLVAKPPNDGNVFIEAALGYAVASAATGDDKQAKERYTQAALECVRQAKSATGPTSSSSRKTPTSSRSATTRDIKPCSRSSRKRCQEP